MSVFRSRAPAPRRMTPRCRGGVSSVLRLGAATTTAPNLVAIPARRLTPVSNAS
jgi:hypothetical protein